MIKQKNIKSIIYNMGIGESLYQGGNFLGKNLASIIRATMLRMRGYKVSKGVRIGSDCEFFQGIKEHVSLGEGVVIGSHIRIKAGFKGKITIEDDVLIDDYSYISSQNHIRIGKGTLIAAYVYIIDFDHKYPIKQFRKEITSQKGYMGKEVNIGEHVWIGAHVTILKGVAIGNGSIIGAGSVVTKSIPVNSIAVGNPAKVIRRLK